MCNEIKKVEVNDPEMLNPYGVLKALLWLECNHAIEWGTVKNSGLSQLHELSKGVNPRPLGDLDHPYTPS